MGDIISLDRYLTSPGRSLKPPAEPRAPSGFDYVWFWNSRLPERKGERLRLICSGRLNSALIEFAKDGWTVVTSRNALRKNERRRQPA